MHNNKMDYDNIFDVATMSFNVMCNDNPFCYNASTSTSRIKREILTNLHLWTYYICDKANGHLMYNLAPSDA